MRRLIRDARGGILILAAVAMGLAAAGAALAVDLGSIFHESRRLQGIADAAAIAAADDPAASDGAVRSVIAAARARSAITHAIEPACGAPTPLSRWRSVSPLPPPRPTPRM